MKTHRFWLAASCLAAGLAAGLGRGLLEPEYQGLVCRGVEESGRLIIGQPGFGPHLVSLFVTGPNPLSASQTTAEHLAWVNDPRHSYVADGTGALAVWAHPQDEDIESIQALPGLHGIEVHYGGDGVSRDRLWDAVLRGCLEARRPFLWGFAADDTHSLERIGLSWFAARLAKQDEFPLKAALRDGAFYVSNGPVIEDIGVAGRTIELELGQEADVLWLRAGQFLGAGSPAGLTVTTGPGENRCLRIDRGVRSSSLDTAALGPIPGRAGFFRAVVRGGPDQTALTQPWRTNEDGRLENPYPAAGVWVRGQAHNHTDSTPAESRLERFRRAYEEKGQTASFSTDYSYWESPHQWLPPDGTPQILSVEPDRLPEGQAADVIVRGINFGESPEARLGDRRLEVLERRGEALIVSVPADLSPGTHDLLVTNARRFRGCLPRGFTVQSRGAANDGWQSFTSRDGAAVGPAISAVGWGEDVWIGAVPGLARFRTGIWTAFENEIPGGSAYAMAVAPGGGLWIAGGDGTAHLDAGGRWTRERVGQLEKLARGGGAERWGRLAFDLEGRLWAAHRWGGGLAVLEDGRWRRLTRQDGLPDDRTSAVACDHEGNMWVGFGGGLFRFTSGEWVRQELPAPLDACRYISALAAAPDGSMWAAVTIDGRPDIGGLVRFRQGKARAFIPPSLPLPGGRIRDILVTRTGDLWLATDRGAARLDLRDAWRVFDSVNSGLGCSIVLALAEDAAGRIWFATARGVSRFDPRKGRSPGKPDE